MKAQVNGITLHVKDRGQGLPLLLVHAFPLNHTQWESQLDMLTDEFRLIAPDMRGFGASDAPPGPYSMDQFADDLAALLDHLNIEQVVLGGLSMGGYVAFAFVRRHAARLRGLVLADTRAMPDSDEARAGRETNAQRVEQEGPGFLAETMLPDLLAPGASPQLRANLQAMVENNPPQGVAGALRAMGARPDSSELLAQIQVPTLVVVGEQDKVSTIDEMRTIHESIANSSLVTIPDAGHLSNIEKPAAFNAALVEFLRGL